MLFYVFFNFFYLCLNHCCWVLTLINTKRKIKLTIFQVQNGFLTFYCFNVGIDSVINLKLFFVLIFDFVKIQIFFVIFVYTLITENYY